MFDRPAADEYGSFYSGYVGLVPEADILNALQRQPGVVHALAAAVPTDQESFAYAPGKWTVREVFGHLTDAERVFGYRAFRISRGDTTPLASFDENTYVAESGYGAEPLVQLAREFAVVREANLAVLRRLDPARWTQVGNASGHPVSVRALAYIMAGHVRHHVKGLRERYGVLAPA
jgi:hypothetical protein